MLDADQGSMNTPCHTGGSESREHELILSLPSAYRLVPVCIPLLHHTTDHSDILDRLMPYSRATRSEGGPLARYLRIQCVSVLPDPIPLMR